MKFRFLPFLMVLIAFPCFLEVQGLQQPMPFKKVILWGHKLHTGTHSYIHYAFYRAFKHLGYDAYWFDGHERLAGFDFSNSLFITEGNADRNIPHREDCYYILHNCETKKYKKLFDKNRCINLQVYTHDCLKRAVVKADDCIYYQADEKVLYMPWATDLLPHEIDEVKKKMPLRNKEKAIYWVGTIWDGHFGNRDKTSRFETACRNQGIKFQQLSGLDQDKGMEYIQKSYMAPALQGKWQCDVGYIPCRIFKNISYGQMGITNSKTVYDLFKGKIVYNEDTYQLFYDAENRLQNLKPEELFELMDLVKNKHTYINRIEHLLKFMQELKIIN